MTIKSLVRHAFIAMLLGGVCLPSHAQSTTQGAISGTVTDDTNAAVPNARVVIRNNGTNANLQVTTDESGLYRAPQLAPGTYTVTFTMPGFQERRETNVIVEVNSVTNLSPHLKTGDVNTTVEVTADVPVLKFDSPEFGGHLNNNEIENIPINNRRWSALALTTPGVTNDASGFGLLSFRAISAVLNNVQIDGADDNQGFFGEERGRTRAGYSTSQVAVREFQVNTGVYSAEFGRAVGGVVNSVTKSGGNQLHGELYFYNRNSSRSAFVPGANNTTFVATNPVGSQYVTSPYRPKDNRNQYGFGVGGPLVKDKLFWFYAFDAYRRNFPGTAKANNPAAFFVNADAALPTSQTCNLSTGAVSGGTASSTNSAACLLAARLKYTSYGAGASAYNTQLQSLLSNLGSVPRFGNQLINTPKIDWQINSKHHVSFLYHRLRWDSPGGVQTQGTNNYAIDTFGTDFVKLDYGVAKLDSIFRSNVTNELRYQYGRELNWEGLQPSSQYTKNNLINNTGLAPEVALNTSLGFYMGMPYYSFRVAYPDERKWQIGDTASILFGKHNLRVGEDIVHNYDLQNNVYEGNGYINYTSTVNYFSDLLSKGKTCNSSGSGVGNFPCYSFYANGFGPAKFQMATVDYGFFAQDDWKATPRLTLNLGVRYDYESIPAPFAGLNGTSAGTLDITTSHPSDKNNFSPRVGFAYDPFGLGKTVVRGGFGMYFGRIPNAVILNAYENTGSPNSQSTPSFTTSNTSAGALPTLQIAPTGPAPGTRTAYYLDKHLQNPYTEQFDLAVQQDLGYQSVLSLSYLGALGRELPNFTNVNLDPTATYTIPYTAKAGSDGSCGPLQCGTTYNVTGYAGRRVTTGGTTNLGAIDPSFGSVTAVQSNINSNYHALNVDITNRNSKWVKFDANYTWSHALDFSQNQFTAASVNNFIDPFSNPRNNYGTSSLNVRHRAVAWAILNAPGVHGDSAWKYLANGWSLKPLLQMQSGLPYSATSTGTTPQSCYNPTSAAVTCFAPAGTGIAGTSSSSSYLPFLGRNTFTMPRTILLDLRAQKDFTFMEKYSLQLIGEAFNLANHQNVTGINSTGYQISTSQGSTPSSTVNSLTYQPTFGTVTSANSNYAYGPRQIQLALRLMF
ncbi:TonB-dependent receptor [Edaphobacter sp. HDX4]|uniref:TonB-dependent receptor n=1 Tax=Edaphobacter sp. HDX4 TaxID=2794064 RepID=UPI002FE545E5